MVVSIERKRTGLQPVEHEARRAQLEQRLEHGFQLIDRRREAGQDVERWEQRWLRLLQEYEQLCDEFAAA